MVINTKGDKNMKMKLRLYVCKTFTWRDVGSSDFDESLETYLNWLSYNGMVYGCMKRNFKSEYDLSFRICESRVGSPESFEIKSRKREDKLYHFYTKYQVINSLDHTTMGYILAKWVVSDKDMLQWHVSALRKLKDTFNREPGIPTKFRVRDETGFLYESHLFIDPIQVIAAGPENSFNTFAKKFQDEISENLESANYLSLQSDFTVDPKTEEFVFTTLDGVKLMVNCSSLRVIRADEI